jgi:flagellar hook-length control protein FliK
VTAAAASAAPPVDQSDRDTDDLTDGTTAESVPSTPASPSGSPAPAQTVVTADAHAVTGVPTSAPLHAARVAEAPAAPQHLQSAQLPDAPDPNVARLGGAIRALQQGDGHSLTLALTPEHLGRVTVDLVTSHDGAVHLHLRAERPDGAAALGAATHGLRNDLEANGLRLDRVDVSLGTGGDRSSGRQGDHAQPEADWIPNGRPTANGDLPGHTATGRLRLQRPVVTAATDRLDLDL